MLTKVGIICAGDLEVAPIIPMMKDCKTTKKAMLTFYSGTIEGVEVVTLFSGVCKTNAAIATQILIDTYGCNIIINAGTAGGMNKEIDVFDTIISTKTAHWDIDSKILTEFHPWLKSAYFESDKTLVDIAKKVVLDNNLTNVYFGEMVTGEHFIEDRYRDEIDELFSPLSVDMETASVAHVCYVNRIPFISVRSITDTAKHSGESAFELNCDKASLISANFVKSMLTKIL